MPLNFVAVCYMEGEVMLKNLSLLLGIMLTASASASSMPILHAVLADIDRQANGVYLIGYQSVEHAHTDAFGASKYIILDFRGNASTMSDDKAVAKVEIICREIINNLALLRELSDLGYDMVSVAFDDASQFDCL